MTSKHPKSAKITPHGTILRETMRDVLFLDAFMQILNTPKKKDFHFDNFFVCDAHKKFNIFFYCASTID